MWLVVAAVFVIPAIAALLPAISGHSALSETVSLALSQEFLGVFSFTLRQALVSAAICIALAIPGAYCIYKAPNRFSSVLKSIVMTPFAMPGILVVLAMIIFAGRSGWLSEVYRHITGSQYGLTFLYGFWGVVFVHVFYNISLGIKLIGSSWARLDRKLSEAATVLGARPWFRAMTVNLPLLLPSVGYAFLMVFTYSALGFTTVLIFGGGLLKTFEVAIYSEVSARLDFVRASQWAFIQTLLLLGIVSINWGVTRRIRNTSAAFSVGTQVSSNDGRDIRSVLRNSYITFLAIFSLGPFIALFVKSVSSSYPGLSRWHNYKELISGGELGNLGVGFWPVAGTSLALAAISSLVCCALAYGAATSSNSSRRFDLLRDITMMLPITISPLCFGLGVQRLLGGLPVYMGIILFQVYIAFPLVYSNMRIGVSEINSRYKEAAMVLGASRLRVFFSIKLPILRDSFIAAFSYGFAISLGDFSGVALLGRGEVITVPVAIYRLIGHYNFGQATALGSVMALIVVSLFIISDWSTIKGRRRAGIAQTD